MDTLCELCLSSCQSIKLLSQRVLVQSYDIHLCALYFIYVHIITVASFECGKMCALKNMYVWEFSVSIIQRSVSIIISLLALKDTLRRFYCQDDPVKLLHIFALTDFLRIHTSYIVVPTYSIQLN